jgi:4-aminobutyrate aminotransferase-like enzyme
MNAADAARINEETAAKYQQYVNPTQLALLRIGGFDTVEWEGCGAVLRDVGGREYIDCLGATASSRSGTPTRGSSRRSSGRRDGSRFPRRRS